MRPSWTVDTQKLEPKKLARSAGWIHYPAVKDYKSAGEEDARKLRWIDTFRCGERSPSWTAGRQELEQTKLVSSAGWIPYPAVKG